MLLHTSLREDQAVPWVWFQGAEKPVDAAIALPPRAMQDHVPVQPVGKAGTIGPREAAWRYSLCLENVLRFQSPLNDDVGFLITLHLFRVEILQNMGGWQAVVTGGAVCRLDRATGCAAAADHVVPLVGRLDGDNEVVAVGDHHVCDLIQCLSSYLNPIYLQDFVIHSQQPSALCKAPRHHSGNEDTRYFL